MKTELETYLNDHLAGAAGGLNLAVHLSKTATDEEEKEYFNTLVPAIDSNRNTLVRVIERSGFSQGTVRQVVGSAVTRAGIWRMDFSGMQAGQMGRFEMIEALAVGIHGQCLLWRTLQVIRDAHQEWAGMDFEAFEKSALCQSLSIERYRIREAVAVFTALPE